MDAGNAAVQLWRLNDSAVWKEVLNRFDKVIEEMAPTKKKVNLVQLDKMVRKDLPKTVMSRAEPHFTVEELSKLVQWKMAKGTFRPRNQQLAESNPDSTVRELTKRAINMLQKDGKTKVADALSVIAELKGIGPATASLLLSLLFPSDVPFFDEVQGRVVLGVKDVPFTVKGFELFDAAVSKKAERLAMTPADVSMALWCASKLSSLPTADKVINEVSEDGIDDVPPSGKRRKL